MEEKSDLLENPPKNQEKKESKISNLLLGVVVGGAVGSVLGATLFPKSGKDNRRFIKEKSKELWVKGRNFLGEKYEKMIQKKKEKKGFWHWLHDTFYRKK